MPVIKVELWEGFNEETKREWAKELTKVTVERLNVPLDKVTVILHENPLSNWSQAGTVATDPNFLEKSRRTEYQKA
ncbi:tautomerase family protein [Fredinandcohnia humi]